MSQTVTFSIDGKPIPEGKPVQLRAHVVMALVPGNPKQPSGAFIVGLKIAEIEGLAGHPAVGPMNYLTADARGQVLHQESEMPSLDVHARHAFSSIMDCLNGMVAFFPEAAVGKLASWSRTAPLSSGDLAGEERHSFLLQELAPSRVTLNTARRYSIVARAPRALTEGEEREESQTLDATGVLRIDLRSFLAEGTAQTSLTTRGSLLKSGKLVSIVSQNNRKCEVKRE
jgi:hypothetical protein